MRVLVTGSRKWDRPDVIWACLDIIAAEAAKVGETRLVVVHGCALGADTTADKWVRRGGHPLDVTAERHPANWREHPRSAGIIRNRRMVEAGADVCLAFVRGDSYGTSHCVRAAEEAEIPVQRLDYDDLPKPRCPACRCDPELCESDDTGQHCADQSCGSCLHGCPVECTVCAS